MIHPQQPLALEFQPKHSFATYYGLYNEEAVGLLKNLAMGNKDYAIWYCWGAPSVGKSHLLQAMFELANEQDNRCYYLDCSKNDVEPECLEGLDYFDIVCLDAIDDIVADTNWQTALFNFINKIMENNKVVVFGSQKNSKEHQLALKDLASRLTWGINIQIHAPLKKHNNALFCFKAKKMGMEISEDVARYLENYLSSDIKKIVPILAQINEQALSQKKQNITVNFVKKVLQLTVA